MSVKSVVSPKQKGPLVKKPAVIGGVASNVQFVLFVLSLENNAVIFPVEFDIPEISTHCTEISVVIALFKLAATNEAVSVVEMKIESLQFPTMTRLSLIV